MILGDEDQTQPPLLSQDSHRQLEMLADAIATHTSAISHALREHIHTVVLQLADEPTTSEVQGSSKSLVTRGITVRVAVYRFAKSTEHSSEAIPQVAGGPYCQTVTEICGEGLDDYIYCTYEYCVDAISGAG